MTTTVLLPPEIAANTNRWFGRARNYPIFSPAWFRYRSVSMLTGSALVIVLLMLFTWRKTVDGSVDVAKVAEYSLVHFVTAASLVLVGPGLAVLVRRLRLRPRWEVAAIAVILGLGMFLGEGIVMKLAAQYTARTSYHSAQDVLLKQRMLFLFDIEMQPRPPVAQIGLRDPAIAREYVRAYAQFARQYGLPDRVVDGWPDFMTPQDRRLVEAIRAPAIAPAERRALEQRYVALLEKVHERTRDLRWRGFERVPRQAKTAQQRDAEMRLSAAQRAEPPAPARMDRESARRVGMVFGFAMMAFNLALLGWLGGVFDLFAFVRQRGMLGEAHARQELERARAERNAAETRLSVLAAQVEPHFLFNTLASVRSALATDPQRAGHIIDHMVDHLRSTIPQMRGDAASSTVALGSQLAAAQAYLALMHERMSRLAFAVEAEPGLEKASIPPLMLISLVENAVKHGVEPKIGPVRIEVRARRAGDDLEVGVVDDGVGFGTTASGSGIGLANIQERLRALYGERAGLTLKSRPQGGVAATLRLPLTFET